MIEESHAFAHGKLSQSALHGGINRNDRFSRERARRAQRRTACLVN
jgi:hypothetical protein